MTRGAGQQSTETPSSNFGHYRHITIGVFFHGLGTFLAAVYWPATPIEVILGFVLCHGLGIAYWYPATQRLQGYVPAHEIEAENGITLNRRGDN